MDDAREQRKQEASAQAESVSKVKVKQLDKEHSDKRGVTKIFLPSIGKARIELYFTNHSTKTFLSHWLAKDGQTRIYRIGRLCIGVLS